MVSPTAHTVKYFKNQTKAEYKVMGKEGVSGYRDGYITNALLNTPSSISVYTYNSTNVTRSANKVPIFVNTSKSGCEYMAPENYTKYNYTACQYTNLSDTYEVSPMQVIFIDPDSLNLTALKLNVSIGDRMLYIADTGNHCIRSVNLETSSSRS